MKVFFIVLGIVVLVACIFARTFVPWYREKIRQENLHHSERSNRFSTSTEDTREEDRITEKSLKTINSLGIIALIVGVLCIVFSQTFSIVKSGETGLRITMGQVGGEVSSGWNWKIPFAQKIEKINTKQQDTKIGSQIWSETSARTALYYENVIVTYQISADKVSWIYKNVTGYESELINTSLVSSAIKTSSKELSDDEATNRGKIEPLVVENLQKVIDKKYGEGVVTIINITIDNCDFEESYNAAIANKQLAQIEAEKQAIENEKAIKKAEADAKVAEIKAENDYTVKLKTAEANTESTVTIAKANAEAYDLETKALSDEVLQKLFLESWDGKFTTYMGDSGNFIFEMLQDAGSTTE